MHSFIFFHGSVFYNYLYQKRRGIENGLFIQCFRHILCFFLLLIDLDFFRYSSSIRTFQRRYFVQDSEVFASEYSCFDIFLILWYSFYLNAMFSFSVTFSLLFLSNIFKFYKMHGFFTLSLETQFFTANCVSVIKKVI